MAQMITGRMGMTKALKRAMRHASMTTNRKRDKRNQRASYHAQFRNAKGPTPFDPNACGFVKTSPKVKSEPKPKIAGSRPKSHIIVK